MPSPVVVDADVLIDAMRGLPVAQAFLAGVSSRIVLSAITVAELYAGANKPDDEGAIAEVVRAVLVHPVSDEIARQAGLFKRDFGKSHGVGLADAIVAATALEFDAELATLNVRHYPMLKGLRPAYAK